ncbi:unnamed protein product [Sordaria macrospora k-hell]|uniref:WGS project CABT00000000 data, contig 2.4 n=1 Tax=Sordaria macrospora (strain ATCC MYA-333 / DSM 997 / K(L3346) / K-hell) TaxID=771870 RepID=F7VQ76_SORMK|nr:uncharacterized protein SMAC_01226 [Sordaria macrospora k-hell]KAH7634302.1 hypothetical protein B0T09DRAFT_378194 [Sordaria sp. MPI-SDFR-AT-0083]CCC07658.1 unnamed protein product [Sordaria macrospora k-hell]
MAWIEFERDWSNQWPLVVQARRLVNNRLAHGADTNGLLFELHWLRAAQLELNIPWMFYNACCLELEGRF